MPEVRVLSSWDGTRPQEANRLVKWARPQEANSLVKWGPVFREANRLLKWVPASGSKKAIEMGPSIGKQTGYWNGSQYWEENMLVKACIWNKLWLQNVSVVKLGSKMIIELRVKEKLSFEIHFTLYKLCSMILLRIPTQSHINRCRVTRSPPVSPSLSCSALSP